MEMFNVQKTAFGYWLLQREIGRFPIKVFIFQYFELCEISLLKYNVRENIFKKKKQKNTRTYKSKSNHRNSPVRFTYKIDHRYVRVVNTKDSTKIFCQPRNVFPCSSVTPIVIIFLNNIIKHLSFRLSLRRRVTDGKNYINFIKPPPPPVRRN